MKATIGTKLRIAIAMLLAGLASGASAASGEMGTGIPHFGIYSSATGTSVIVWSLKNATITFPSGCNYIVLSPDTMGIETYKIAIAIMTTARVTGVKVRFYAHAPRDGGCGVDYVELPD